MRGRILNLIDRYKFFENVVCYFHNIDDSYQIKLRKLINLGNGLVIINYLFNRF